MSSAIKKYSLSLVVLPGTWYLHYKVVLLKSSAVPLLGVSSSPTGGACKYPGADLVDIIYFVNHHQIESLDASSGVRLPLTSVFQACLIEQ
jgi:hypothetical protein